MAEVELQDPSKEVMPDFNAPALRPILEQQLKEGQTLDELVKSLVDSWTADHEHRLQQYNQAQEERQREEDERERARLEREEQDRLERERKEQEEERRRIEAEQLKLAKEVLEKQQSELKTRETKRKAKVIAVDKPVDTKSATKVSTFARSKTRNFDFVDLYYFSPEGCKQATELERTTGSDALAPVEINQQIVYKPVAAHQPLSRVTKDHNMTWSAISVAKNVFLQVIKEEAWGDDMILALTTFYYSLETHDIRTQPRGEAAIIRYHAEVRREFFEALKAPGDDPIFDIGKINEVRLQRIYDDILREAQEAGIAA
ncbi:hypothetical protein CC1G_06201 [Coprinopsis cinerea okayama7|uniref:Uncharacterized protein n=1 Tax=Coprinopsis cinerea (strain Okayama-7 / 130 / ATCC MYA-4618 / FGSC 9003) TaxID=240176 RepID=A8NV71_COPC7|nr:hypothetical protein CC1G_06201 [Coprinopsis cinerea okayama7\|eukprot:XP_001836614.1 hypothetical protein CC1G_06201 [Coprinopsis cinerea okayama7\